MNKYKDTPLGELNYGASNDSLGKSAWADINGIGGRVGVWNPGVFGNDTPLYHANISGNGAGREGFWNEFNTPIGTVGFGTSDTFPSIAATYQPTQTANYYLQALSNLLGGQR